MISTKTIHSFFISKERREERRKEKEKEGGNEKRKKKGKTGKKNTFFSPFAKRRETLRSQQIM